MFCPPIMASGFIARCWFSIACMYAACIICGLPPNGMFIPPIAPLVDATVTGRPGRPVAPTGLGAGAGGAVVAAGSGSSPSGGGGASILAFSASLLSSSLLSSSLLSSSPSGSPSCEKGSRAKRGRDELQGRATPRCATVGHLCRRAKSAVDCAALCCAALRGPSALEAPRRASKLGRLCIHRQIWIQLFVEGGMGCGRGEEEEDVYKDT